MLSQHFGVFGAYRLRNEGDIAVLKLWRNLFDRERSLLLEVGTLGEADVYA
jgi:hypothetical protein